MHEGSVQTRAMSQGVSMTGGGRDVRLTLGGGVALPLRREQFRSPKPHRRVPDQQPPRELDILVPGAGKLPFVGRQALFAELRAWLDDTSPVLVHAVTGPAGLGKTRLALEFCASIDSDPAGDGPWLAGFMSPVDLPAMAKALTFRDVAWERQTLLVLDGAAQCHEPLARWLDRLASQEPGHRLRILLLERETPNGIGWWHDLARPDLQREPGRFGLFFAPRPTRLPELAVLEDRRALMSASLRAARAYRSEALSMAEVPSHGMDPAFDARLAEPQFGNPLSLVMAGVIALDDGVQGALALRRLDAARRLGNRELARLIATAGGDGRDGDALRHLIAFNGLAGGLPAVGLRQTLAAELAASQRGASLDRLLPLLQREYAPPATANGATPQARLATIQPDLIGGAVILEAFASELMREADVAAVVRRTLALGQGAATRALTRFLQDYAGALGEPGATDAETAAARHVLEWLLTLAHEVAGPEKLVPLVIALPLRTTPFREVAVELTARVADYFRHQAKRNDDPAAVYTASAWIGSLAVRLSELGRRDAALEAEEEALQLHRMLAEAKPDAFMPVLAGSLGNLANSLGGMGRREAALEVAEEAVQLYRTLAAARPDAFTHHLASLLSTLAAWRNQTGQHAAALKLAEEAVQLYRMLAAARPELFTHALARSLDSLAHALGLLGRHEPAQVVAEKAVQLYRALAVARPEAFTPELATSLGNFAGRLSGLGQHEAALTAADEVVQLRRGLAEARPDVFTPDLARSLNSLANALGMLGRHEAARVAAEKAVQLCRVLAKVRPDRFTPELAASLSGLGVQLSALDRREAALKAAEEAVALYRVLADATPDALAPTLAKSLFVLGELYGKIGRPEHAVSTLREAVVRLTPAFETGPAACGGFMTELVKTYASRCKALGLEPDMPVLAPVLAVFNRLRSAWGQA